MAKNSLLFITCISLLFVVLLAGFASADKLVHYNTTYNIQERDGSLVHISALNGTDSVGYSCLNADCTTISSYTIPGLSSHSDTSIIDVTFPTLLDNSNGYAIYFYKPGYIPWKQQKIKISGTGEMSSSLQMKLSKLRNCSANLSSFTATRNGGNVDLRINVSSPIANYDNFIPNAIPQYFRVDTIVTVNVTDVYGNQVYATSQTYSLNYSERRSLLLSLPLSPGDYYISVYSLPNDAQCLAEGSKRYYSPAPGSYVELDTRSPSINIVNPSNGSSFGADVSSLNYIASDRNLRSCWYSTNGGAANSSAVLCGINFTGLTSIDGTNTWTVYANDSFGNLGFNTTTFYVDRDTPRIWFESNSQVSGIISSINSLFVNITANDSALRNITLWLYNSTQLVDSQSGTSTNYFYNFTGLDDGAYFFNATACDSMNHCNSTETRNVTIDASAPGIEFILPLIRTYNTTQVPINISVTDFLNVWYFNGTGNNTYPGFHYLNFLDGIYTLYAYANDSADNFNWTSITFGVDTTYPVVNITLPSDGYNSNNASVDVAYTIIEQNPNNCWWTWSNEGYATLHNLANCSNGTLVQAWAQGNNTIIIYANDSAGNTASDNVTFFVDSMGPSITSYFIQVQGQSWTTNNVIYISPLNSPSNQDGARFNITASEIVDWVFRIQGTASNWIESDNTNFLRPSSCPYWNGTSSQCSGTSLSEGNYSVTVTATDSSGNNVTDNSKTIVIDNTSPSLDYSGVLNNGAYNSSVAIIANASDNVGVAYTNLTLNGVLYVSGTPITLSGLYTFEIYAQDLAGNLNYTQVNFTVDVNGPDYSNIFVVSSSPAVYSPGAGYSFNITWQDLLSGVDTALFFINNSAYSYSESINAGGANFFNASFALSDLAAGNYTYYFWANDTIANANQTPVYNYEIRKASQNSTIAVNPDNSTITYPASINVTCAGTLMRSMNSGNYSDVSSEAGLDVVLGAGNYTYWCYLNESQNYSYSESFRNILVLPATGTGTLLLNGNASNIELVYPADVNASFTNDTGAATLYMDGADITSSNNQDLDLAAGIYNFTLVIPSSQNYSGVLIARFANISKASQTINMNVAPNTTVVYPTPINVTCDGELFRNTANVTNEIGADVILGAGSYNYSCRKYESQNFSSAEASQVVTVNPTSQNATLTILPGTNVTYPTPVNATCNGILMRSMNGGAYADISSENGLNIVLAGGSYSYWCYLNATQNSSYSEMLANVTVNPLVDVGSLLLNGNASNIELVYPADVNASFTNDTGVATLYRNSLVITDINNIDQDLAAGLYNFTLVIPGSQNNTGLLITWFANISKASQTINMNVAPNTTVVYPTPINVTCDGELFRNTANVTNEIGADVILGAGSYNYSCVKYGNENVSSAEMNATIIVMPQNGSGSLMLNGAEADLNMIYPNSTINASFTNLTGPATLYLNGADITSSNNQDIDLAAGLYNFTLVIPSSQNYTSFAVSRFAQINQSTGSVYLYINDTRSDVTILNPLTLALNATLNNGIGAISLYLDGNLLNSSSTLNSILSNYLFNRTGMFNATASYSGNQNYTSSFETYWINVTDNAAPGITVNLPANGTVTNNQNINFTANFSDNFGLANATIYLYNATGLYNQTTINLGGATQGAVGIVIYLVEGVYSWFWQVLDLAGNSATSDNSTLAVDINGPSIAFVSPENETYNTTIRTADLLINITNSSDAMSVWFFNGTGNMTYPGTMNIEFGEGSYTLVAYANDSLGNMNFDSVTFNVYLIRTIINSWIYGTFYPNNQTIDVLNTTITSSTIENSWLNGPSIVNVTNSTIRNSNLTDMLAELLNCTVIDSNLTGVICQNSFIDPSNVGYSNITADSNVTNSYVWYSTVANSDLTDSIIQNDTLTDSTIIRCNINTSTVDGSTMIDCTLIDVVANNSYVFNSTLVNTTINDANITNGIIYNGTIVTVNGSTYNATEDGEKNLTDLINYPPVAGITSPSNGGSYVVNSAVSFIDGSTDANLQSSEFNESLTYLWDFGDNSTSTLQNDSHAYSSTGTYNVSLTVKDRYNASNMKLITVTITTPGSHDGGSSGSSGGSYCSQNWTCNEWSVCYPNGVQTRICTLHNPSCTASTLFDHSTVKNCTFVPVVLAQSNLSAITGNATNITSNATFFQAAGQKVRHWASITGAAIGANKVPIFWAVVFIVAIIIAIIITRYVVLKKSKGRR